MSYHLVNETQLAVEQEIDEFVANLPSDHPFTMALSLSYFRGLLIAKILNKIPNRHKLCSSEFTNTTATQPINGISAERLLIEEMIHSLIPEIISDKRYRQLINQPLLSSSEELDFHYPDPAWWVKIHTITPCVTYYFGPFKSQKEAKQSYPGYLDDLKNEQAIGISANYEFIKPDILTVTDSPVEMKQDIKKLWQRLEENQGKLLTSQQAFQEQWNILPGNYVVTGLDGTIKNANRRALHLFGTALNVLQGKSIAFFVPQPQLFCIQNHIKIMRQDQKDWQMPYCWSMQFQTPKQQISVDVSVTQQKNAQGQAIGLYWSLHNTGLVNAESNREDHDRLIHYGEMAMSEANRNGNSLVLVDSNQFSANDNDNGANHV